MDRLRRERGRRAGREGSAIQEARELDDKVFKHVAVARADKPRIVPVGVGAEHLLRTLAERLPFRGCRPVLVGSRERLVGNGGVEVDATGRGRADSPDQVLRRR